MRVVGLVSGGKDSILNLMFCSALGHEIVAIAQLIPGVEGVEELDSPCFQTVGHQNVAAIAECLGVPLRTAVILRDQCAVHSVEYSPPPQVADSTGHTQGSPTTQADEVEEMYVLLRRVKEEFKVEAVSSGAILSDYQRLRVESCCSRLELTSLAFLYMKDAVEILELLRDFNVDARLIKTASMGLDPKKHLGKSIVGLMESTLLPNKDVFHIAGEGGEFESFVVDCPLFKEQRLSLVNSTVVMVEDNPFAPVGHLTFNVEKVTKSLEEQAAASDTMKRLSVSLVETMTARTKVAARSLSTSIETVPLLAPQTLLEHRIGDWASFAIGLRCSLIEMESATKLDDLSGQLTTVLTYADKHRPLRDAYFVMIHSPTMTAFKACNAAYVKFFTVKPPARAFIEMAGTNGEIVVDIYYAPPTVLDRKVLHVQSISSWCAASIGPYAQANLIPEALAVAGRIALVPETLKLIVAADNGEPSGEPSSRLLRQLAVEFNLMMENTAAGIKKMGFPGGLSDCTHFTFFVVHSGHAQYLPQLCEQYFGSSAESICWKPVVEENGADAVSQRFARVVLAKALPLGALVEVVVQRWGRCTDKFQDLAESEALSALPFRSNPIYSQRQYLQ